MLKEDMGIKDKVHIILRGPDGQIKEERKLGEVKDAAKDRHGVKEQAGD